MHLRILIIYISIYSFHSCSDYKTYESRLFNIECYNPFIDSTFSNWKTWEKSIIENDANRVTSYFDTLSFDRNNSIYIISMTLYKDKVSKQFNWNKYIKKETQIISKNFKLKRNGYYFESGYDHYWFLVDNKKFTTYMEYITTNPLSLKTISISKSQNRTDLCRLLQLTLSIDLSEIK